MGASDQELVQLVIDAIKNKKRQHAGAVNIAKDPNRPMILIGG